MGIRYRMCSCCGAFESWLVVEDQENEDIRCWGVAEAAIRFSRSDGFFISAEGGIVVKHRAMIADKSTCVVVKDGKSIYV